MLMQPVRLQLTVPLLFLIQRKLSHPERFSNAEKVHVALVDKISLPVILSSIDRQVNLRGDKKGKNRAAPPSPTTTSSPPSQEEEETNNTPADGISSLSPAPTPEGLIPSMELPTKPTPPRVSYDLPQGVEKGDCAIFYLGGESLGLNNLLMTSGGCSVRAPTYFQALRRLNNMFSILQVWSYNPKKRESRLESSKTNRMLMRRYAIVEKAKDADVIGILVGTLGVGTSALSHFSVDPPTYLLLIWV